MNNLTPEQKNDIRLSLLETIKDDNKRQQIMSIALAYADENGKDGDIEKMVHFLLQNPNRVEELYDNFVGYISSDTDESKSKKK